MWSAGESSDDNAAKPAAPAGAFGDAESELDIEDFDALFNDRGGWDAQPADWGDPEEALGRRQFLDVPLPLMNGVLIAPKQIRHVLYAAVA
jgi:hypothetical protein